METARRGRAGAFLGGEKTSEPEIKKWDIRSEVARNQEQGKGLLYGRSCAGETWESLPSICMVKRGGEDVGRKNIKVCQRVFWKKGAGEMGEPWRRQIQ